MNWKSSVFSSGCLMHTPSLHSPQNYSTRGSSWVFPLNFNKSIFTNELTFKKKRFIYLLAVLGFPCCVGFSLIAANEGYSSLRCAGFSLQWLLLSRNTGSRCSGFSSCSLWAQELYCGLSSTGLVVWWTGLVVPRHMGSSRIRDQTRVPYIARWILNNWTTREAHELALLKEIFLIVNCITLIIIFPIACSCILIDIYLIIKLCPLLFFPWLHWDIIDI